MPNITSNHAITYTSLLVIKKWKHELKILLLIITVSNIIHSKHFQVSYWLQFPILSFITWAGTDQIH